MPCGIAGSKERVDRAIQDGQRYEAEDQCLGISNEHRQDRDTENINGIAAHSDGEKKPFTLGKTLQNAGRKDAEAVGDIGYKGQDTDIDDIDAVGHQKAGVEQARGQPVDDRHQHCR